MRMLGIIPARGGSKRVPRKNVRPLAGRPLVLRAVDAAASAKRIQTLVVSSDDPEVLQLVEKDGRARALPRPAELAGDTSPAIDYVRHALSVLEGAAPKFDGIVIIQPSSPLTLGSDIDGTIALLEESGADTAVSMVKVGHDLHPAKFKRMDGSRVLPFYEEEQGRMASHELPEAFVRNCSVYASRRDVIERGVIIGEDCRGFVMPRERSVDINDELDFEFAEFLCSRLEKR
jgi:CMP-N,N'-diacetyllegionaminic acid synthase